MITLSARQVYRLRACDARDIGVTVSVVLDANQSGVDADAAMQFLAQALKDVVPDAVAVWVERLDVTETELQAPVYEDFQAARTQYRDSQRAAHVQALAERYRQQAAIDEQRTSALP